MCSLKLCAPILRRLYTLPPRPEAPVQSSLYLGCASTPHPLLPEPGHEMHKPTATEGCRGMQGAGYASVTDHHVVVEEDSGGRNAGRTTERGSAGSRMETSVPILGRVGPPAATISYPGYCPLPPHSQPCCSLQTKDTPTMTCSAPSHSPAATSEPLWRALSGSGKVRARIQSPSARTVTVGTHRACVQDPGVAPEGESCRAAEQNCAAVEAGHCWRTYPHLSWAEGSHHARAHTTQRHSCSRQKLRFTYFPTFPTSLSSHAHSSAVGGVRSLTTSLYGRTSVLNGSGSGAHPLTRFSARLAAAPASRQPTATRTRTMKAWATKRTRTIACRSTTRASPLRLWTSTKTAAPLRRHRHHPPHVCRFPSTC